MRDVYAPAKLKIRGQATRYNWQKTTSRTGTTTKWQ